MLRRSSAPALKCVSAVSVVDVAGTIPYTVVSYHQAGARRKPRRAPLTAPVCSVRWMDVAIFGSYGYGMQRDRTGLAPHGRAARPARREVRSPDVLEDVIVQTETHK